MKSTNIRFLVITAYLFIGTICAYSGEDWLQYKYDCRNSGNVPERNLNTPWDLVKPMETIQASFNRLLQENPMGEARKVGFL